MEQEAEMGNWNDDRLDDLNRRMETGFKEMREGFARMDAKFERLPNREEIGQRFESTERRIDRVNLRLEHIVWAMLSVGGALLGNVLIGRF